MTKIRIAVLMALLISTGAVAHHSYAPYDIRNPVKLTGIAKEFVYRRPHPELTLTDQQGVEWEIEVPLLFWDRNGYTADTIKAGDELVILGWPARDGDPEMALSGFTLDGTFHNVLDRIGQQFANEAADRIEAGEDLESVLKDMPEAGTGWQGREGQPPGQGGMGMGDWQQNINQ